MGRRRKKAMSLRARREVIRVYAKRYRAARTKCQKNRILGKRLGVVRDLPEALCWTFEGSSRRGDAIQEKGVRRSA